MTQAQIDGLRAGHDEIDQARVNYEQIKSRWQYILDAIENSCDHKNPDGSSAVLTDFIDDICLICNAVLRKET